jgi:hypothetical protein
MLQKTAKISFEIEHAESLTGSAGSPRRRSPADRGAEPAFRPNWVDKETERRVPFPCTTIFQIGDNDPRNVETTDCIPSRSRISLHCRRHVFLGSLGDHGTGCVYRTLATGRESSGAN